MSKPLIINIISGKGGTGKTLLAAVLAEMLGNKGLRVLVVDLDIFVRGLTVLLYFQKGEKFRLTKENQVAVADLFIAKEAAMGVYLGIERYRSFDMLPSVRRIDEQLNYSDILPNNRDEAKKIVGGLLKIIPEDYSLILLDSRAGYDELISATHIMSDISICVEEDDKVSRVTSDNLVRQLESDAETPLFRLRNKDWGATRRREIEETFGITHLGVVPFDMDVMKAFGSPSFWEEISRSLYKVAVARAWNRLNKKMDLSYELKVERISPLPSEAFEKKFRKLTLYQRVIFVYGIIIATAGFVLALSGPEFLHSLVTNPIRLASLIAGVLGAVMAGWAAVSFLRRE